MILADRKILSSGFPSPLGKGIKNSMKKIALKKLSTNALALGNFVL
ncbi:hypothetical protein BGP_3468 [Beggiatoa sp. PS]|nr:hypothetical protein BGP_3468 [Beggiatoa sp. PS]